MASRTLFLLLCLCVSAQGKTIRFDMRDGLQRNVVHFISDAPLEKVVGISTALWGWLEMDPDNISRGVRGEFEMDMRTFETGIPSRNQQIRDKIFLASEAPVAKFTVKRLIRSPKKALLSLQPVTVEVDGELFFRGLTVAEKATLKLTFMVESEKTRQRLPGNLLRVQSTITLDLPRYQIEIPDLWHLRFSPKVQVNLDAVGTDQSPAGASVVLPPDGPKPKERPAVKIDPIPTASPSSSPSASPIRISPTP